jgi:sialate O-acetylesterase
MMKRLLILACYIVLSCFNSNAQLRLPAILSSGMVLQQYDSVYLWGWANPDEPVTIKTSWNNQDYKLKGLNTGKWKIKISTPAAGGPYIITVKGWGEPIVLSDVLIGEVWVCSGQSNMEWSYNNGEKDIPKELATCYNKGIRFFHIPRSSSDYPQEDVHAQWKVCDSNSLKSFSAVGYFFGKKLNSELNIPIGLINASWGGTSAESWTPAEVIHNDPELNKAANILTEVPWGPVKPGKNYNGIISPITSYSIAGAIWYQGEANVPNGETYNKLLSAMIDSWRALFRKQFPFYLVQIAPFTYGRPFEGAIVQEQQIKMLQHSNTGVVIVTDLIDSVSNIHPTHKKEVGNRLANWALAETYHKTGIAYKNPLFKSMEIKKNKIILSFDNADNGLMAKDKIITGFYMCGNNKEWLPADVMIDNNKIILSNKKISNPQQVRYGFGNGLVGNIFSKEGLPLIPFRTDNWKVQ